MHVGNWDKLFFFLCLSGDCTIEECFSKTHSVHFNPFRDYHIFVFIAIYEKFFDYILILNCLTLTSDCLYIKREDKNKNKNKNKNKTKQKKKA